ncbi:hypothetical protein EVAR_64257_1 [Eumeta japonica]|uniref:Uncharacterized protein n=1 Tax=Eumeta variegata TaxID=151549 RepID=A0A4C1YZ18_EUMVA|nr:hypothetical protein EVAR_64257_1 [Eumeta japonica]
MPKKGRGIVPDFDPDHSFEVNLGPTLNFDPVTRRPWAGRAGNPRAAAAPLRLRHGLPAARQRGPPPTSGPAGRNKTIYIFIASTRTIDPWASGRSRLRIFRSESPFRDPYPHVLAFAPSSGLNRNRNRQRNGNSKRNREQNRESRLRGTEIENGTKIEIECGTKIGIESVTRIEMRSKVGNATGIENGARSKLTSFKTGLEIETETEIGIKS